MAGGCGASDPAGAPDGGPARVDIGVGADAWQPLAAEQVVELHLGLQGGRHMVGNARIEHLWPGELDDATDAPRVEFAVFDERGGPWSADLRPRRQPFVASAAGGHELDSGFTIYMMDGAEALDGQRAEMRVDIEDMHGVRCSDARWVRVRVVDHR